MFVERAHGKSVRPRPPLRARIDQRSESRIATDPVSESNASWRRHRGRRRTEPLRPRAPMQNATCGPLRSPLHPAALLRSIRVPGRQPPSHPRRPRSAPRPCPGCPSVEPPEGSWEEDCVQATAAASPGETPSAAWEPTQVPPAAVRRLRGRQCGRRDPEAPKNWVSRRLARPTPRTASSRLPRTRSLRAQPATHRSASPSDPQARLARGPGFRRPPASPRSALAPPLPGWTPGLHCAVAAIPTSATSPPTRPTPTARRAGTATDGDTDFAGQRT